MGQALRPLKIAMKKLIKSTIQPEPDWPAVRARYEAREETVVEIALSIGVRQGVLTRFARDQGWTMRSQKPRIGIRSASSPPPQSKPITSTDEAIIRLKELVQSRIARMEHSVSGVRGENERGINAANLLARTLEKVLELEEQQRKQSRLAAINAKRGDDAWREELAGRIARLSSAKSDDTIGERSASAGTATGLASLGP